MKEIKITAGEKFSIIPMVEQVTKGFELFLADEKVKIITVDNMLDQLLFMAQWEREDYTFVITKHQFTVGLEEVRRGGMFLNGIEDVN